MWPEVLERNKAAGCLSAWQVSQLALGFDLPEAVAHQNACERCGERVAEETHESASCSLERVPAALLSRGGTQPWRRRVRVQLRPALVLTVAGVLALAVLGRFAWVSLRSMAKGLRVVATVTRDGTMVHEGVSIAHVGPLRGGDRVRLRVHNTHARWVRLQGQHGGTLWDTFYEGPLPQDGWLPSGFTAMPLSKMRLRLLACPTAMSQGGEGACEHEQFEL